MRLAASSLRLAAGARAGGGGGGPLLSPRHIERRAVAEAETMLRVLIAGAQFDGDQLVVAATSDPRFGEVYSGLYWQAHEGPTTLARSRSLWDVVLRPPADALSDGAAHVHALKGPRGATLLAVARVAVLTTARGGRRGRWIVALDRAELTRSRDDFARDLALGLVLLAGALAAASVAQVDVGLRPLREVRAQLSAVRSGDRRRMSESFPREVLPLAAELNLLLDERDAALLRARGRAADLAHGLKTPLSALAAHMRALRARGEGATAAAVDALAAMMRRHVDRELARARAAAGRSPRQRAIVRGVAEDVAAAAARMPAAQGKAFDFDLDADLTLPIDRTDLEELLGNLVDNAARHARATVTIAAQADPPWLEVRDDGPGLDASAARRSPIRGERLDEGDGDGLGLAIVADLAEAYAATLTLGPAPEGGLAARVTFRAP